MRFLVALNLVHISALFIGKDFRGEKKFAHGMHVTEGTVYAKNERLTTKKLKKTQQVLVAHEITTTPYLTPCQREIGTLSVPLGVTFFSILRCGVVFAAVAQLVEHSLGMGEISGSSPLSSSTEYEMEEICPGIAEVVNLLNAEGFVTTDSGDGSHLKDGMECAWDVPMVVCLETIGPGFGIRAKQLLYILRENGYEAQVEATYSPNDGIATIIAYGEGLRSKS